MESAPPLSSFNRVLLRFINSIGQECIIECSIDDDWLAVLDIAVDGMEKNRHVSKRDEFVQTLKDYRRFIPSGYMKISRAMITQSLVGKFGWCRSSNFPWHIDWNYI